MLDSELPKESKDPSDPIRFQRQFDHRRSYPRDLCHRVGDIHPHLAGQPYSPDTRRESEYGHTLSRLMLGLKQVIDRFNGIKGSNWNLYKKSNPLCHGSIP